MILHLNNQKKKQKLKFGKINHEKIEKDREDRDEGK